MLKKEIIDQETERLISRRDKHVTEVIDICINDEISRKGWKWWMISRKIENDERWRERDILHISYTENKMALLI